VKAEIHPEYVVSEVTCTCGNQFTTRSTQPEIRVEICSECHPFYTGKQKMRPHRALQQEAAAGEVVGGDDPRAVVVPPVMTMHVHRRHADG